MTTPWERIEDGGYRSWLSATPISADEYNSASLTDRRRLRTQYLAEEKQFATSEDVQKWLSDHRKVPTDVAAKVAQTLFEVGYTYPSSLLNIQRDDLNLPQIIPPYRNVLFNKLQQQPQPQQPEKWSLVVGTVERNQTTAGCRHALFKIASGGYYPANTDPDDAFAAITHPDVATKRLFVSVSVVFVDKRSAEAFVVNVDSYVSKTRGVRYYQPFTIKAVEPYGNHRLVLVSDYSANEANGESPHDLPVWNVEVSDMDLSLLSPTTIFSRTDTVYKYQRIETDRAFARAAPEGAHIFPKVKCKGKYEWLDKPSFKSLAPKTRSVFGPDSRFWR